MLSASSYHQTTKHVPTWNRVLIVETMFKQTLSNTWVLNSIERVSKQTTPTILWIIWGGYVEPTIFGIYDDHIYIDILGVFPGSFSGGRGREEAGGGNGNVKIDQALTGSNRVLKLIQVMIHQLNTDLEKSHILEASSLH